MGLDVIVVLVLIGLTLHGFRQGFLKGAGSLLTPVVGIWLALRYSRGLADCFSSSATDNSPYLLLAALAILAGTFVVIKVARWLFSRLFDYFRIWDLDRFLGGALGLVKATVLLWIVIAFVFIAYPDGRAAISRAPISNQILLFGENVPFLQQRLARANRYLRAMTNPLTRYQVPTLPGDQSQKSNLDALKGLNLDEP